MKRHEVIVVGGGGSGLAAAVSAAQNGLSVLLLEKMPQLGGTTGIAVGSFTANGTAYQKKLGIVDNADDHEEDAEKFNPPALQGRNNDKIRRFFLENSAETIAWLTKMGLRFQGPTPEPPNRVARMHNIIPNAKAYIAVLQSKLQHHGGTILCQARAEKLLTEHGRVVGLKVRVNGKEKSFFASRGVVLAAGDYASSKEMISQYKGKKFSVIDGINPNATGDGHLLAQQAGAELLNMDVTYGPELRFIPPPRKPFSQLLPASGVLSRCMALALPMVPKFILNSMIKRLLVTWQHPENSLFDDGAILINQEGERFCNEPESPEREIAISSQTDKIAYVLLDKQLVQKYSKWPHFISTAPEIAYAYVDDYRRMRPDVATVADNLENIAKLRQIPITSLRRTIEEFNRFASGDSEDRLGRTDRPKPFQDGQWALLGPVRSYFTMTEGSPPINTRLQVLNPSGKPIPGLYAVGQNGLGQQILWGHGLHIGWAVTSGRLVGKVLATQTPLETSMKTHRRLTSTLSH